MDKNINTIVEYPLGETEYNIPFDYLSRKFVFLAFTGPEGVRQDLVNLNDYRFVSKGRIRLSVTPGAEFTTLEIKRFTSATERVVDFSDGSILRAADLNVSQVQSMHIAEEARDAITMEIQVAVAEAQRASREAQEAAQDAAGHDASSAANAEEAVRQVNKAIRVPDPEVYLNALPPAADRAGHTIAFDDQGQLVVRIPVPGSVEDVMIRLGSSGGMQYIGTVPSVAVLKTIEPSSTGSRVTLRAYFAGSTQGGSDLYGVLAENAGSLTADDGVVFKTAGGNFWVRHLADDYVTPEMFGAQGNPISTPYDSAAKVYDDEPLSRLFKSKYHIRMSTKLYAVLDTIWAAQSESVRNIDMRGAKVLFDYPLGNQNRFTFRCVNPLNPDPTYGIEPDYWNIFNGTIKGTAHVDSKYNDINRYNGLMVNASIVSNVTINGFCDGLVLRGFCHSNGCFIDNCRDDFFGVYNQSNAISDAVCGHCAGDGVIIKGDFNLVCNVSMKKAGVHNGNPEPGFLSGCVVSYAQDGVDGRYNMCANIQCDVWGGGVMIMGGHFNTALNFNCGSSFYTKDGPNAPKGNVAAYISGEGHYVDTQFYRDCVRGVHFHDKSTECYVGTIRMGFVRGVNALTCSGTGANNYIHNIEVGRIALGDSVYVNWPGMRIGSIRIRGGVSPYYPTAFCRLYGPCQIGELTFYSSQGTNELPVVDASGDVEIGYLEVLNVRGVAYQVTNGSVVARRAFIQQAGGQVDSPVKLTLTGSAWAEFWRVTGNPPSLRSAQSIQFGAYSGTNWQTTAGGSVLAPLPVPSSYRIQGALTSVASGGFNRSNGQPANKLDLGLSVSISDRQLIIAVGGTEFGRITINQP